MKLTKDEARILAAALSEQKHEIHDCLERNNMDLFEALGDLEGRLAYASRDKRIQGRTSLNDFHDCLKRFVEKFKTVKQ